MKLKIYYLILLCCLFAACAPLDFAMANEAYTTVDVVVTGSKGGALHVNGEYADFDIKSWHALLKQNKGGKLIVRVCAEKDGEWTGFRDFTIDVSNDELGEWGLTYRRIAPSYELYSSMGLYQRDLSNFDETELLVNSRTSRQCINCHTANKTSNCKLRMKSWEVQWFIHIGILEDDIAHSQPIRHHRCFIVN